MNRSCFVAIVLLLIVWGAADWIAAEKVAALPEILAPYDIKIDEEQIYITQHEVIYIYSLKDYSFKKNSAKKAKVPGSSNSAPITWFFSASNPIAC